MFYQEVTSSQLNKIANPKPPVVPLVDMRLFLGKHVHLALNQLAKKYGDIFQVRVGARNFVVLSGVETIKEALVKQQDIFKNRADFDIFKGEPQSGFLEVKSGERWKKHHDIFVQVMHTFLTGKSDMHESWVKEEAEELVNNFLNSDGQPFDPELYLPLATLSFIQRLLFSKKATAEDADIVKTVGPTKRLPNALINGIISYTLPKIWQPIFGFFHRNLARDFIGGLTTLENYISKNIKQHRESLDPENLRDITDGLLQASDELTESERNNLRLSEHDIVKGSLIQFVGAGMHVPNYILRWALLYTIAYPDIQAEIQKELDEVVGREQKLSFRDRSKLPFTEACINEILRHSSITTMPAINYATNTDTTLGDYFIPKNTPLLINYYGLTRDERYWEEPEKFNPYRFLDENGKFKKDLLDKFYPFGIGARRCIGEYLGRVQIFTFFTELLRECKFEKVPGEKLNFEAELPGPFVYPKKYRVIVKPRF